MNRTHSFKLAAQKQNYEEKGNFVVKTKETFTFLSWPGRMNIAIPVVKVAFAMQDATCNRKDHLFEKLSFDMFTKFGSAD